MLITLDSTYEGVGKKVVGQVDIGPVITTSGLDFLPPDEPVPKVLLGERRRKLLQTHDFLEVLKKYDGRTFRTVEVFPQEPAYFTYTSGTAGPPKGAMNTHENVVFNAKLYTVFQRLDHGDVVKAPVKTGMV